MNFQAVRTFCLAFLLAFFYRAYSFFWRFRHVHLPQCANDGSSVVYAHWHGDELLLIGSCIGKGMAIMASRSRDGELMKRIAILLGYRVVRGSSTRRGAEGLKSLISLVIKERCSASLAVDGPRGPIYRVKPGILKLAQQTESWLVPGAASCSSRFVFKKAWNQCYLPLPFSKCVIVYGEPIKVPKHLSDEEFDRWCLKLECSLKQIKVEAEAYFDRRPDTRLDVSISTGVYRQGL